MSRSTAAGRGFHHERINAEPGRVARLVGLEPSGVDAGRLMATQARTDEQSTAADNAALAGPRNAVEWGRALFSDQRTPR